MLHWEGVVLGLLLAGAAYGASAADKTERDPISTYVERRVDYPDQGARLGSGWDSVAGRRTDSTCVEFVADRDQFQTLSQSLLQVTDYDYMRSFTSSSSDVGGSFNWGGVSGSANATFTSEREAKITQRDVAFVASASVINGASFVRESNGGSGKEIAPVRLRPDMAKKVTDDPREFAQLCGDYFVSSITTGAEIRASYVMSSKDYETIAKATKALQASGSYAGFTGKASSTIVSEMTSVANKGKVRIIFAQRGGTGDKNRFPTIELSGAKGGAPATVSEAIQREISNIMASLPGAAVGDGGRPLYMNIRSYDSLPNWPTTPVTTPPQGSERNELRRFIMRMDAVLLEIQAIAEQVGAKKSTLDPDVSVYLWEIDERYRKRAGIMPALAEAQNAAIKAREDAARRLYELEEFGLAQVDTDLRSSRRPSELNDLRYLWQLPLPELALPEAAVKFFTDADANSRVVRLLYAATLYHYWVVRPSVARCRVNGECSKLDEFALMRADIEREVLNQPACDDELIANARKTVKDGKLNEVKLNTEAINFFGPLLQSMPNSLNELVAEVAKRKVEACASERAGRAKFLVVENGKEPGLGPFTRVKFEVGPYTAVHVTTGGGAKSDGRLTVKAGKFWEAKVRRGEAISIDGLEEGYDLQIQAQTIAPGTWGAYTGWRWARDNKPASHFVMSFNDNWDRRWDDLVIVLDTRRDGSGILASGNPKGVVK